MREQSDWNLFALGNISFAYDLGGSAFSLEGHATLYTSKYADLDRLDLGLFELAVGPSFNLGAIGWERARLGVYAIVVGSRLRGETYSTSWGAGTRLRSQLRDRAILDARFEVRDIDYDDSDDYPTASLQSGDSYRFRAQIIHSISPRLTGF